MGLKHETLNIYNPLFLNAFSKLPLFCIYIEWVQGGFSDVLRG
jgi:hypothetical protein